MPASKNCYFQHSYQIMRDRLLKPITAFFIFVLLALPSIAQDSTGLKGWTVESKKTGEGSYEITFQLPSASGWQVYSPNQTLLDVKTTELKFGDSSIVQQGDFIIEGQAKKIKSSIFETD